jgi:hypothetical protein
MPQRKVKVLTLDQISPWEVRQVQYDLLSNNECTVVIKRSQIRIQATPEQVIAAIEPFIMAKAQKKAQAKAAKEAKRVKELAKKAKKKATT